MPSLEVEQMEKTGHSEVLMNSVETDIIFDLTFKTYRNFYWFHTTVNYSQTAHFCKAQINALC